MTIKNVHGLLIVIDGPDAGRVLGVLPTTKEACAQYTDNYYTTHGVYRCDTHVVGTTRSMCPKGEK